MSVPTYPWKQDADVPRPAGRPPATMGADAVVMWRCEQLAGLGFGPDQAAALAESGHVDLGAARRLITAGCDLDLAFRILF